MNTTGRRTLKVVLGIALTVALVVIGIFGFVVYEFRFAGPSISRTTHPLSRAEAQEKCPIPLPARARNVEYAVWGHWMAFIKVVRFEAPPEECVKHIDTVLTWHDEKNPQLTALQKGSSRPPSYSGVHVTHVDRVDTSPLKDVPWFNPDIINHGVHAGQNGGHTPEVWVDLERGVFYYCETD